MSGFRLIVYEDDKPILDDMRYTRRDAWPSREELEGLIDYEAEWAFFCHRMRKDPSKCKLSVDVIEVNGERIVEARYVPQ